MEFYALTNSQPFYKVFRAWRKGIQYSVNLKDFGVKIDTAFPNFLHPIKYGYTRQYFFWAIAKDALKKRVGRKKDFIIGLYFPYKVKEKPVPLTFGRFAMGGIFTTNVDAD